jgi:hypothetical protein
MPNLRFQNATVHADQNHRDCLIISVKREKRDDILMELIIQIIFWIKFLILKINLVNYLILI